MADPKPLAVFTRNGVTKNAWTPAECVDLQFHGWTRKGKKTSGVAPKSAAKRPAKKAAKKAAPKAAPAESDSAPSRAADHSE